MALNFWDKVRGKITAMGNDIKLAKDQYREWAQKLYRSNPSGNKLMSGADRLFALVRREQIGRMIMFFYDPKHAADLPYYDRFPLVIPIELYNDGFLGINLHYLPPLQRAKLLDSILSIYEDAYLTEKKKLQMSYQILTGNLRSRLYEPCIKRYLFSHCRSKFFMVDPQNWHVAVLLPTERFEKATKTRVWAESMMKVKK